MHNAIEVTSNMRNVNAMLLTGYQRIRWVFAVGLLTTDCRVS